MWQSYGSKIICLKGSIAKRTFSWWVERQYQNRQKQYIDKLNTRMSNPGTMIKNITRIYWSCNALPSLSWFLEIHRIDCKCYCEWLVWDWHHRPCWLECCSIRRRYCSEIEGILIKRDVKCSCLLKVVLLKARLGYRPCFDPSIGFDIYAIIIHRNHSLKWTLHSS